MSHTETVRVAARGALAAIVFFLFSGCVGTPQTRAEFLQAVREQRGHTTYETETASRSLDSLISLLEERAKTCLTTRYRASVREVGSGRAEFTVQIERSPQPADTEMPPGGFYLMAVDLVGQSETRTQVHYYLSTMGHDDLANALRAWGRGERSGCPHLS